MRGTAHEAYAPLGEPPHPSPAVTPVPASRQADWRSDEREPWLASVRPHPRLRGEGFITPCNSTSYGKFGESVAQARGWLIPTAEQFAPQAAASVAPASSATHVRLSGPGPSESP